MDVACSIVVPAFNESQRLPPYLAQVRAYADRTYPAGYEVVVVDDGSSDETGAWLDGLGAHWPELRVLHHPQNRGKGAAVRTGMLAATGRQLLMADADGATPIEEEARLTAAIEQGVDMAIGSRLLPDRAVERRRRWTRGLLGRLFAQTARWWLGIKVRDTQCGFKMFRREVAQDLFAHTVEDGFLFDLEMLRLAQRRGYTIREVAIHWSDVPGGHLRIGRELPRILAGLWRLRWRAGTG